MPIDLPGDGVRLAAEAWGDPGAPPVLFFHGGGQSRRAWAATAQRVAEAGYRGISIDLRGHGESGWSDRGDYGLDAYARDVACLLDHFDRPAALVGASRGGQAALIAASDHPIAPRLVMLADVSPYIDDAGVDRIRGFFRASDAGFASVAEATAALHAHLGQSRPADPERLARSMRSDGGRLFWRWDPGSTNPEFINPPTDRALLVDAARRISCPVVLVRGECSDIVSAESAARFGALTPQLTVEVAAGAGHMFTADHNAGFAASLLDHLARHAEPTR